MSAVSGVHLAMLPADESEFRDWLATTGEIWAVYRCNHSIQATPAGAERCGGWFEGHLKEMSQEIAKLVAQPIGDKLAS